MLVLQLHDFPETGHDAKNNLVRSQLTALCFYLGMGCFPVKIFLNIPAALPARGYDRKILRMGKSVQFYSERILLCPICWVTYHDEMTDYCNLFI